MSMLRFQALTSWASIVFSLGMGVWCIGWPESWLSPWLGAINFFCAGALVGQRSIIHASGLGV